MAHSTFSLSWDLHKNNICNGLSVLQQNEEFVDMTLAADGHHVKVHQMIMALASPYIKELILSATCPHPVIFLNKISYSTLSAILEYIYTGEVLVAMDNLTDLVEAARELHIKGLEEMDIEGAVKGSLRNKTSQMQQSPQTDANEENEDVYFEVAISDKYSSGGQSANYTIIDEGQVEGCSSPGLSVLVHDDEGMVVEEAEHVEPAGGPARCAEALDENLPTTMQFTVSNQGSLQMILNRYLYFLKHTNRNFSRQWRCVDYLTRRKCPALVVTRDDIVVQRISAHSHPFHDKRILKKVYSKAVFTALHEAEKKGNSLKSNKTKENCDEPNSTI